MHKLIRLKVVLMLFILSASLPAFSGEERVDADIVIYDQEIARMKDEFSKIPKDDNDKEWVKKKLAHMVELDQYTRQFTDAPFRNNYSEEEKQYFWRVFGGGRWLPLDRKNTEDLKQLLEKYTWFKISEFGVPADRNAWLLVQHADQDIEFQKKILVVLENLYLQGETLPMNFAYLFDRVAVHDIPPRLQRFGTQGQCVGQGQWEPDPMEDPENIDIRRATVDLEPMAEYKKRFKDICH